MASPALQMPVKTPTPAAGRLRLFALHISPVVAAGILLFARLSCPLLEPEETRYAEIPRQMLAAGNFLTPVWHGEAYWQKPPLFYWLVMASYRLFGIHDWAARLVPCLAAFATVLVVYGWAWRSAGPRAGLCSALVLALSARFLYQGRMVTLDGLLALWVTVGLAAGHLALWHREIRWRWWLLSAAGVGLGVLTKGPIALALVTVPLGLWSLRQAQSRPRAGHWLAYLLIVGVIAAPWYAVVAVRDADAAGAFFWLHNLQRYLAPFDHAEPVWFLVPILLVGTLPWSLLAIPLSASVIARWRRRGDWQPRSLGFFAIAFVWAFVFLSISGCKRPSYVAPLLPLWALVLGTFLSQMLNGEAALHLHRRMRRFLVPLTAILFVVLLIGVLELLPAYHRRFALRGQVRRYAGDPAAVLCYPRRWDSIGFYLGRDDVRLYAATDRQAMMRDLVRCQRTLVFVKKRGFFDDFLRSLPPSLEFVPCSRQGPNVVAGFVRQKEKDLRRAEVPSHLIP